MVVRVDMLSYMFLWDLNTSVVSLKIPSDSAVWVPIMISIDAQSLSMQFMRAMGW